jgi:glycosyltransferase involved in cell wall biosynthesis
MERIHVMHVTDTLALGGKERMLTLLANQLVSNGIDVSVCVTRSDLTLAPKLLSTIPVRALGRKSSFDLSGFRTFKDFIQRQKPDVFHAHGRASFSFLAFLKTIHKISAPIIFHDHYGPIEIDEVVPVWFRLWGRYLVDYYVGVYSKLGDWALAAGVPSHKICVIENGIDTQPFREARPWDLRTMYKLPPDKKVGVLLGGIRPEKGLDMLIQVVAGSKLAKDVHFLVVGNKQDEKYVAACLRTVREKNITDCFTFVGQQTAIPEILRGANFAVMPSRSESGPLVLIEYLAAGLPVVAFQVGALSKRAAELGVPGFVQSEDIETFSNQLDCLLAMKSTDLIAQGLYGQRIAQANFDITQKMPEWYGIYEHVLDNKRRIL